jgi:hypothetical protein
MSTPLLLGWVLAAVVAVAAIVVAQRRIRDRAYRRAMADRLAHTYPPVPVAGEEADATTLPLRSPEGRVAIRPDGLSLHLGRPPEDLRLVPWSRIKSVVPVASGRFVVDVSRVGPIEIPAEVGRRLWESFGRHETNGAGTNPERARSARV